MLSLIIRQLLPVKCAFERILRDNFSVLATRPMLIAPHTAIRLIRTQHLHVAAASLRHASSGTARSGAPGYVCAAPTVLCVADELRGRVKVVGKIELSINRLG